MSSEDESGIMLEHLNHEDELIYMEYEIEEKYRKSKPRGKKSKLIERFTCSCSGERVMNLLYSIFPILYWLPRYETKENIVGDIAAGLTVGIVQIPQGMAYALLATLPPIVGMYVSFFPVLLYPIFGTSRHLSIGTFAVVSILISDVLSQRIPDTYCSEQTTQVPVFAASTVSFENSTTFENSSALSSSDHCNALYEERKIEVAIALSISVGLIQVLMYVFRLGIVTVFLSDSLLSGFVSGASIHVITSQIPKLFGITVPRHSGPFALIYVYIDIFKNLKYINWATFVTSVVCTVFLIIGKELNSRYRKKLPIPIPWELGIVIFSTLASYYGHFENIHKVVAVGNIPTGISTTVPRIADVSMVMLDSIPLAVVAFTVEISLCKMFATKHGYQINPNQELLALGACNIFGAFFSCFPSASSLSRSVIYEEIGGKTQIGGVISSVVVLSVLLWIGPLFEPLPQASLAVIIIVNIKGLVLLLKNVKPLWKVSQLDAMTWLVTWFSVILFGVGYGLMIGVGFSLLTIILRTRRAKGLAVRQVAYTDAFRDRYEYETLPLIERLFIFRFTGPLCFANRDRFSQQLIARLGFDPMKKWAKKKEFQAGGEKKNKDVSRATVPVKKDVRLIITRPDVLSEKKKQSLPHNGDADYASSSGDENDKLTSVTSTPERRPIGTIDVMYSHIIFDMAHCSLIDSDGGKMIRDLYDAFLGVDVRLMLASCNDDVKHCLGTLWGERDSAIFISVKTAIEFARNELITVAKSHVSSE